jgi:hypothetical protein
VGIWTPPNVSRELREESRRHEADLLRHAEVKGKLDYWNEEAYKVDPHVEIIKAKENAHQPGLRPGYYHFLIRKPGAPASVIPIEYPNGSFRDLDSGIFELLKESDVWSSEHAYRRKERERALERAKERDTEERRAELAERITHALSTSIQVPRSIP